MLLRQFTPEDADLLSRLIIRNLRRVNIRDYSAEAVEALVPFFTPERLIENSKHQYTIVCTRGAELVGTASLDGDRVRTVFVAVDMHGRGIGRTLMAEIETHARENGVSRLYLHAGLSAQGFYERLGYDVIQRVERELEGIPIPDIKMEKVLS